MHSMDLGQVTLTQMRYAVAVQASGNFRMAAEASHVTQSGLSMQIQRLEELLEVTLFDRSRKPVLVTEEGHRALGQMREVLRETERLGQIVAEDDEPAGLFRLGVIPTLSPTVLPLFLGAFIARYPRVELVIEELKTSEIVARLLADSLDAGLAATPLAVTGLSEEAVGLERMLAYLPPKDPLLRKVSITQKDLSQRQLWVMPEGHCFRSQVLAYCGADRARTPSRIRFESGSFETLVRLVDDGLGATVIPALVAEGLPAVRRRAQVRPLVAPTPVREIGLVSARADLRRRVRDALVMEIRRGLESTLEAAPRRAVVLDPLE